MSKVLIVDDDPDSGESLAALVRLSFPGQETLVAADGDVGLELALLHYPAVVILDVEMPDCDGLQAAAKIRAALGRATPVLIGVSGNVPRLQLGMDAGLFDRVFTKPIVISELLDVLSRER